PSIDQITLAGLIAYDRTTITGVIDRLAQKGLVVRQASARDRRSRELLITDEGRRTLDAITPAVEAAQRLMVRGLSDAEARELVRLMQKAIAAGNELSRAPLREGASER
ncbi:MAG: MarR family transcriptional regulator, partial [Bradyrhizobium sp.]